MLRDTKATSNVGGLRSSSPQWLDRIPTEILLYLFDFLPLEDAVQVASTCKQYFDDQGIWVALLNRVWRQFGTVYNRQTVESLSPAELRLLISLPLTLEVGTLKLSRAGLASRFSKSKTRFDRALGIVLAQSIPASGRWLFTVSAPESETYDGDMVLHSWDLLQLIREPAQVLSPTSSCVLPVPKRAATYSATMLTQGNDNNVRLAVIASRSLHFEATTFILRFSFEDTTPLFTALNTVVVHSMWITSFQDPYVVFEWHTEPLHLVVWDWRADEWAAVSDGADFVRKRPIFIADEGMLTIVGGLPPHLRSLQPFRTEAMSSTDPRLGQPKVLSLDCTSNVCDHSLFNSTLAWEPPNSSKPPRIFWFHLDPLRGNQGGLVEGRKVELVVDMPRELRGDRDISPRCRTVSGLTLATTTRGPDVPSALFFIDPKRGGKSWVYELDAKRGWRVCPVTGVVLRVEGKRVVWHRPGWGRAGWLKDTVRDG